MVEARTLVREGVTTGLLGAAGVAAWFLAIDTLAGHPLFTPDALGRMLFGPLGVHPAGEGIHPGIVAGYTLFHCAAFAAVGLLAALLVRAAERQPVVLALFVVLFAIIEMGFYGLTAVLDTTGVLGGMAWWQIAGGNLVATALMGGYLWRRHPALAHEIDLALSR
jgi:FtsH-binding integral membrane protein